MMNKQDVLDYASEEIRTHQKNNYFQRGYRTAMRRAYDRVKQLDEPKKAVVPQYIDTWIQGAEYNGFDLYEAMTDETPDKTSTWIVCNPETFAKAWIYGYEVEKEKLYTVKFSNEDFGKTYIGIIKTANKIGISTVPINDECSKCYFTKSELEEFKFWNNPAFEIKEVTE